MAGTSNSLINMTAWGAIGQGDPGNYATPSGTDLQNEYLASCSNSMANTDVWRNLAQFVSNYVNTANSFRPPSIPLGLSLEVDWEAIAKRYARHSPRCDTGGTCDCGFGELEKLMTKAGCK